MTFNDFNVRVSHYLRHRFAPRALILLYHRVADLPADPQLLCTSPQYFEEHLQILRKYTQPMDLETLIKKLIEGRLPRRAVVLTFDDGYADNLYNARPLLERFDIPATVFVATGQIGRQEEYWWDELDRLLLQPGTIPEVLSLTHYGSTDQVQIGETQVYPEQEYRRYLDWHIEQPVDPTRRHALYRSLYHHLHAMPEKERQASLAELRSWAGVTSGGRPSHRTLSAEEIVDLADGGLIAIGAHTISHPALAGLPSAVQCAEIQGSKTRLGEILGQPVTSFAYPHGSYSEETLAIVRELGFSCACSSDADAVWTGADYFRLPRVVPRNWDGEEFSRWIRGWMGA